MERARGAAAARGLSAADGTAAVPGRRVPVRAELEVGRISRSEAARRLRVGYDTVLRLLRACAMAQAPPSLGGSPPQARKRSRRWSARGPAQRGGSAVVHALVRVALVVMALAAGWTVHRFLAEFGRPIGLLVAPYVAVPLLALIVRALEPALR